MHHVLCLLFSKHYVAIVSVDQCSAGIEHRVQKVNAANCNLLTSYLYIKSVFYFYKLISYILRIPIRQLPITLTFYKVIFLIQMSIFKRIKDYYTQFRYIFCRAQQLMQISQHISNVVLMNYKASTRRNFLNFYF